MSIVCKQLIYCRNLFLSCSRSTMVKMLSSSGGFSNNQDHPNFPSVIREVQGDLFTAKRDTSLAHCVSSDMKMGAGIAVHFRLKFGRVDDLLSQKKTVGEVAYLKDSQRIIFYLVTKKRYYDKPTENTLHSSLLHMREKCEELGIRKLAMPRIGCGLDGLKWPAVFQLVQEVFKNCGMEITIYSIPDKSRKSMTPGLNRSRENFRNFFEPRRPHSMPASAMNSKRKFHSDSGEEDFETPKRRKVMNSSSRDRNYGSDSWSPAMKVSTTDKNSGKRLSTPYRKSNLEFETLGPEAESLAEVLQTFSGDCPFMSSTKKRSSLTISQNNSFDSNRSKTPKPPAIPFLCEEDQSGINEPPNIDYEEEGSVYSDKTSKRKPKYSHNFEEYSTPVMEGRRKLFTSSDQEDELGDSNSRHYPDHKTSKSRSASPDEELNGERTPPPSSKKRKERSTSKSHSEEKVKKEKRRSASRSGEKDKKEKRRSSSKSRTGEKIKKSKKRSKSHSEEKIKKEKRFKSRSAEKVKKEKRSSLDILERKPLHSFPSEIKIQVNLVSDRFPSCNKKKTTEEHISSPEESETEMKPKRFEVSSTYGSDLVRKSRKQRHSSPQEDQFIRPSSQNSRSEEKNCENSRVSVRKSFEIKCISDKMKGRLGIVESPQKDDSLPRKAKKTPRKSSGSPKVSKKTLKSPIGKMYSDQETSGVSVKQRLSL